MFAWVGQPDPAANESIYGCGKPQNYMSYCSRAVTKYMAQGDILLNDKARTAVYNKADKLLAQAIVSLPLYQKPTYLVYQTKVHNFIDNPSTAGPGWNAQNWWISH
jgi:peptide/nickel transport system substrate-binding protein